MTSYPRLEEGRPWEQHLAPETGYTKHLSRYFLKLQMEHRTLEINLDSH